MEASLYLTERPSQPYPVPLLHTSTPLSTPTPTRGSVALPRVPREPSPASGAKPTHLLAPPPARTASCPSNAWAGAPRSHLRLLLPAPAVGITPARLQPACPSPATRGRLEARNLLLIPLATAAGLGTFFFFKPAWPQASCWGAEEGRRVSLCPIVHCTGHLRSLKISKLHPCP